MIIDFHTHIFPDKLAPRATAQLAALCNETPSSDGTAAGLLASMKRAGISLSIALPVLTRVEQFDTVNEYAAEISHTPGIISFGGIHPDDTQIDAHLDRIAALGLRGIKLHPDYQHTFIDDEKYIRIISGAVERGLIVSIHSGLDAGYPEITHCTAERAAHMLDLVGDAGRDRIVLAHSGCCRCPDEAIEHLAGREVFFDLGYTLWYDDAQDTSRVIRAHGADRILFATDCPWNDQADDVRRLSELGLAGDELEAIRWRNAARLLGMDEDELRAHSV